MGISNIANTIYRPLRAPEPLLEANTGVLNRSGALGIHWFQVHNKTFRAVSLTAHAAIAAFFLCRSLQERFHPLICIKVQWHHV
jgi:hypothetical protein